MGEKRNNNSNSNRRDIKEEANQAGPKKLELKDYLTTRSVRESVLQGMS